MKNYVRRGYGMLLAGAALIVAQPISAQGSGPVVIDLPAQSLGDALKQVGTLSGWEVLFQPDEVAGLQAPALHGRHDVPSAISALLSGSALRAEYREGTVIIRGRASAPSPVTDGPAAGGIIVVTGTRIPGATAPSPTTVVTLDQMRDAGRSSMADVLRDLPQNFGGGNNPGVGTGVPSASGLNIGSAVSINLRGIGQDATLTLLNGHRLSYNASRQGVDISAIPLLAVDRIEVVADGASAIYGSDAVAGVANILLRRDYDGVAAMTRLGMATDGGGVQRQFNILGGKRWSTGGVMVAFDIERDGPILARQRSYTASRLFGGQTLYPSIRRHGFIAAGHQAISDSLTFAFDALYNRRTSRFNAPFQTDADYLALGSLNFPSNRSFAIAPSLRWDSGSSWVFELSGVYGRDRTRLDNDVYFDGAVYASARGCYCNSARSVELNGNGTLFALPGGDAKLAVGGGYRRNALVATRENTPTVDVSQDSYYGFGELSLPLLGPAQGLRMVRRLIANVAVRYEDYPGIDRIATPKLGLVYEPTADIAFKASWGKSFRAPTLFQQYTGKLVNYNLASRYGGVGYAATATALYLTGGRPDLKPEKATSWSTTLDIHPRLVDGLRVELSYFNLRYRDRIASPIISGSASALSNPLAAPFVNFSPSDADKSAALAGADSVFLNAGLYDPATVVAIIDNRNLNVSAQRIEGVDAALRYRRAFEGDRAIAVGLNGTYLKSRQRSTPDQPSQALAGTIFNPPHVMAHGFASWSDGPTTLTASGNYVGDTEDRRFTPDSRGGGMTTLDLSLRHRTTGDGLFGGLEILLSVQNLLNAKPDFIRTVEPFDLPYDSTNNTPLGRFVNMSLTKHF